MTGPAASPEFLAVFRVAADANGAMSFARFMELALYHPQVGYYRRERVRVGYAPGTDFYTASTSGTVFGELVASACASLLQQAGRDPRSHRFVEIGAESAAGVLAGVTHPFATAETRRIGDPAAPIDGDCVMFSNELFDAQPFRRTVFRGGCWRELGVRLDGTTLTEVELGPVEHDTLPSPVALTREYHFDRPEAAAELATSLTAAPWRGLFVAFDYGKSLRQLVEDTPGGTARAYYQHTQSNALLERPGEQDLTCHVCWDWLEAALVAQGFAQPTVVPQETFFIRHAGDLIAATSAAEALRFSPRKLSLMQLLHPAHLGQKFQVLHALR